MGGFCVFVAEYGWFFYLFFVFCYGGEPVCALPILPLLPWWFLYLQKNLNNMHLWTLWMRSRQIYLPCNNRFLTTTTHLLGSLTGRGGRRRGGEQCALKIHKQEEINHVGLRERSFYAYKSRFLFFFVIRREGNCLLWMRRVLRGVLIVPTCKCVSACVCVWALLWTAVSWEPGREGGLDKSTAPAAAELR